MALTIEKSIDTRGYWIIDKSQKKPCVLKRVWAMPDGQGTFDVYELESSLGGKDLYDFNGRTAGYFRFANRVPERGMDSFMISKLEKTMKYIDITQSINK